MPTQNDISDQLTPPNRGWLGLGWGLWLLLWLIISIMVISNPAKRTVTPLYHAAVEQWQQQESIYAGPLGMNYLPAFVPLFVPYHAVPLHAGEVLWRTTAFAGFCLGVWWFTRKIMGETDGRGFALVTLMALPLCLGALRNGQANAHLGAALLLAAVCLANRRWWLASIFLGLSVAIKPLGLAAVGLAFAAFPHLWWRLAICVLGVLVLPFAFGPFTYVQSQYLQAYSNLRECSEVTEHRFADINGLLRTFGIPLVGKASLLVRAFAGIAFAVFCFLHVRKLPEQERALGWLAFSAGFLMVFNPMNESNSYVILAPVLALWAWHFGVNENRWLAWTLVASVLTMGFLPELLRPWLGNAFALAWHPAMTMLFLTLLGTQIIQRTGALRMCSG